MSDLVPEADPPAGPITERLVGKLTASVVRVVKRLPPAEPRPSVVSARCLLLPDGSPRRLTWRLLPVSPGPARMPDEMAVRIFGDVSSAGRPLHLTLSAEPVRSHVLLARPRVTVSPAPQRGPILLTLSFGTGEVRRFVIPAVPGANGCSVAATPLPVRRFAAALVPQVHVALSDRLPGAQPANTLRVRVVHRRLVAPVSPGLRPRLLARVIHIISRRGQHPRRLRPLLELTRQLATVRPESVPPAFGELRPSDRRLLAAILGLPDAELPEHDPPQV